MKSFRKLAHDAGPAWEVPRDLLLGRYPDFVTGGPLARGDIPVFVFHSLEPESFGRKLRYLAENGYSTLSADEYFRALMGAGPVPERAVLLTFDDGRSSVWGVGAPLLRRYAMRGVVFLVPGRMRERPGPLPPTWEEVEAGRVRPEAVLGREQGEAAFLSWEEVEALSRAGYLDFQSHSLLHARIHVSPQVAGFATPQSRRGYAAMDLPLIGEAGRDLMGEEIPLGTPLLRSAPRLSESLRFHEEPYIRTACVEAVTQQGGEGFFARKDWETILRRLTSRSRIRGRLESPAQREAAIRTELAESKRLIEARTGKPVVHLAYPWHASGPSARRLVRELGYRTAFSGKVPGVPITRVGGDPETVARIGEDYLELLPGRDRLSLSSILYRKLSRRLSGTP
ncbi:MAG TPA: polysaccharide deacetylase family protein [Vicinamibacteria bacterium]|jgi:peptidoglycan/xylan/chitin deacetylase (PgdA/CDA1 family)|nr:polysaccharide deacetylase family protein [Vicinamibacteria bacterium]